MHFLLGNGVLHAAHDMMTYMAHAIVVRWYRVLELYTS
jgi:hypothetical protein